MLFKELNLRFGQISLVFDRDTKCQQTLNIHPLNGAIMKWIISLPQLDNDDASDYVAEYRFGYYETTNFPFREEQEDALAWHVLNQQQLTPTDSSVPLTRIEIGHRLWTSYQLLENASLIGGTTASTTVCDGKGNLITATLADAVTFAAVYNNAGDILGVVRLNSVTHKPTNPEELVRIQLSGGMVYYGRVNGSLAVSRAIGDNHLKKSGVCSEAHIDITNTKTIIENLNVRPEDVKNIQIITTCDGFTDGAGANFQSKKDHEDYLLEVLQTIQSPGKMREDKLCAQLVKKAIIDNTRDNVSIAIQTLYTETSSFLLGLYDGHGGKDMACHAANNIGRIFTEQCALPLNDYAKQPLSVHTKRAEYKRDNYAIDSPETWLELTEMIPDDLKGSSQTYASFFQPGVVSEEKTQGDPIFLNNFGHS